MRSEVRLDSAVFQLTPTRTRCDLVIIANGKTEKIASGLLNPFLAHLKAAQDQIAKGGYSITLEPDPEIDAPWFTKGTVERFVRFVSTPEILERVTTIESEILQIENAITIQGNDNLALSTVEDHQTKMVESIEGSKATVDADEEKAIVLYKPGSQTNAPESTGPTVQEQSSKVQLLRVLETRKIVLQKEQGMAFARAVAAGFDMDNMAPLVAFAENFGALRLQDACTHFMELWKKKHETGQWVEVEALEAVSERSEFSYLNGSGIVLTTDSMKQKEPGEAWPVSGGDTSAESNGKEKQIPLDAKVPLGTQEHFSGQFQHPAYSQWPMHSPPGAPVYQPYPMPGMPYYQSFPGVPYFAPPYPQMDDPRFKPSHRKGSKRRSMDNRDSNNESETWERSTRSQDTDDNESDSEKESSHGRHSHKKIGHSGKKKSVVVVRNIHYIASKKHGASGSESTGTEDETEGLQSNSRERKHKSSSKTSMNEDVHAKSLENSEAYSKEEAYEQVEDPGNWQAFQSFLLSAEERTRTVDGDMFSGEKESSVKRKQNKSEADPLVPTDRGSGDVHEHRNVSFDSVSGMAGRMKQASSSDEMLISIEGRGLTDNQFKEIEGGEGGYRKMTSDEFLIYGREKQLGNKSSLDQLSDHAYEQALHRDKSTSYNVTDDSFMLPNRSASPDHIVPEGRAVVDINSEFSLGLTEAQDSSNKDNIRISYEPDDFSLVPERGMESVSISYDPAFEYDVHIPVENVVSLESQGQEDPSINTKEGLKKSDKDKNSRASQGGLDKRRKDAIMKKGIAPRMNPSAEAQKRADNLRSFKADLQKLKKEREDEEIKRLEALKKERQKRIAARSSSVTTQSPTNPQQTKARLTTKLSPSPFKGSKFNDPDPGSSSPVHKLPVRITSTSSNDSKTKLSRLNGSSNELTRSVSSLPEVKKESNGLLSDSKSASLQTKRLSDPNSGSTQRVSSLKSITKDQVTKKLPDESQTKKITAIRQLDESKSATLPELKLRISKPPSDASQKESYTKETLLKGSEMKASQASDSIQADKTNDKPSRFSNGEDNPVIEKTVVMLESNMVSAPMVQPTEGVASTKERLDEDGLVPEYAAIRAPPSPVVKVEDSSEGMLDDQLNSYEVVVDYSKDKTQSLPNSAIAENPYQAPYARATSLEDPASTNREYAVAASVTESKAGSTLAENIKAHVSSFEDSKGSISVEAHETYEKPRSKETKGLRKLLKFGRKNHNSASGDGSLDSNASVDDHAVAVASSNDVHMLKNLISQDDSHAGGTPPKVSRPFSLLSPFKSKNSEKKLAV